MAARGLILLFLLLAAGCTEGDRDAVRDPSRGGAGGGDGVGGSGGVPGGCRPADGGVAAPYGLDERPANPTCRAPPRPSTGAPVRLERAFAELRFDRPLGLVHHDSRWHVVEKAGRVLGFRPGDQGAEVVLDIRDRVEATPDEAGLLALAFHPSDGRAFVLYTTDEPHDELKLASFSSTDGGRTLDPRTEKILFTTDPERNQHNGGQVAFGPDGLLYVSLGDGGNGYVSQDPGTLLGKVVRLDVDGGDPAIFASGFRNPFRFSFDRETGTLWLGDVGQGKREEVDIVVEGANYGWNIREGDICHKGDCGTAGLTDPIWAYDHDTGRAITGGSVYRGEAIPALHGAYLFADFIGGTIWGLFPEEREPRVLVQSSINPVAFAEDPAGELYVVDHLGGGIHALVADGEPGDGFPRRLSETGCFDVAAPLPALIPYDINASLWSDGADKERWLAIPDETTIAIGADGDWELPVGTVLVKTFSFDCRPVETRLFVRHDDGGWAGYTYEWNEEGTDAILLPTGKTRSLGGGRSWTYPSRSDCMECHTAAAGRSLGLETAQLNREIRWPDGRRANVVETLAHVGILAADPGPATRLPALPDPFGDAPLGERARSYLHGNCAACHRPDGSGQGKADYRYGQPMGICGAEPEEGDLGVEGARVLAPGDAAHSLVALRMRALGEGRMPPVGSAVVDEAGVELIEAWIGSMDDCD